ncbi:laccase domain-containing protein [Hydrogenophaga sp.]|uniref:polyphenol oxidase family protein n=1 Tax=Hydrogenophaga sp. TaxID=1904254 RepID=UPI0019C229AF|nr:laccase domain-containing protein [Hydrogenophaga sp.]MBD3893007.1 laccase [Hydrogenophaga sp.]
MTAPVFPADWLVPDWPAPPGVRAVLSSRAGGVSLAPFDSFNLGEHVRDDPLAVAENRARLAALIACRAVFLQQVHGAAVLTLEPHTPDGLVADASLTQHLGLACVVMVADCLPVLFCHRAGTVVAAAHAGWRGLAGVDAAGVTAGPGVLAACFAAFVRAVQDVEPLLTRAEVARATLAWLGPCIGPQAFEVGPEVRQIFLERRPQAQACFVRRAADKYLADLPALARLDLQSLGITQVFGNDASAPWCTVTQTSRFFSHRRDAAQLGSSGRMAACIWRV